MIILGIQQNIIWGLKISKTVLTIQPLKVEMGFLAQNMFLVTGMFKQECKGQCRTLCRTK